MEDFGLPYVATGNLLRTAVTDRPSSGLKAKEYMDRGDLVPDDLIIAMILRVPRGPGHEPTASSWTAFRARSGQAEALEEELDKRGRSLTAALLIEVDEDTSSTASRAAGCASRASTTSTCSSTRPSTRSAATSTAAAWCSATTTSRR